MHALEHLAQDQGLAIAGEWQPHLVHIGRPPNVAVFDAPEDRVLRSGRRDDPAAAFLAVVAVMVDPGFAQHQAAEASPLLVPGVALVSLVPLEVESMRGR